MAIVEPPCILVIAGSDSSGGAGIARDIETVATLGGKTCLTVTAITAQTHGAVRKVEPLDADLVAAQMQAALEANTVSAVKIGMLGTQAIVAAVASVLRNHPQLPVILDPVMVSSSGGLLLPSEALDCLKQHLLPLCRLITPNLPEIAVLSGASGPARNDGEAIAQAGLFLSGKNAVLIKGGHGIGPQSGDILLEADGTVTRFEAPRLQASMRGTGCMLASAVATHLAFGRTLSESVLLAKQLVFEKLLAKAPASAKQHPEFKPARVVAPDR